MAKPLRILHVITSLRTGGAERLMVDLLPRLRDKGMEIELAVFDGTRTDFYHALKQQGIPIHILGVGLKAMHSPKCILPLRRLIRQFDVVHTHNTPCQFFAALACIGLKNAPKLVTTEHSTNNDRRKYSLLKPIDRWMYGRYTQIIGVSESTTQALLDYLPHLSHCQTINNGIDVRSFQQALPAEDLTQQFSEVKRLVMAAAFRAAKDHETVICALHHLPQEYHLLLAGDGERRKMVEGFVESQNLSHRVHFLGNRQDVAAVLKTADVVVMSSHYEGFGLSAVEGFASGRPVVASNVPGLREIIGGAGILFPQGDALELAHKILALEQDEVHRQQTIERGTERAWQYDISTMVDAYSQVYYDIGKTKIIRISTVPISLNVFCKGLLQELSKEYEVVAVSSPGTELEELETREKVRTVAVPMQRHISPIHDLISLWQLFWLFRKERPTMVHSITPKAGLLSMIAAKLAGVPIRLHTFTGLIWPTASGLKRKILVATDKLLCFCATHLNPEGRGVAHDLQTHITHKPLTVLGHGNVRGIDFEYYKSTPDIELAAQQCRADLGIPSDAFVFLFVGRIVRDKGIVELLEAFKNLTESYAQKSDTSSPISLLLVGDEEEHLDPLPPFTQQLIRTLPNVYRLPYHTDVRPFYATAQALVFPSYREGFPNVVLEAGAFSLPSIVTDINGSREIITNEVNGLIIPPQNIEALTQAMQTLLHTPHLKSMGKAAYRNVQQHFSKALVWQQLKDYYQHLLQ